MASTICPPTRRKPALSTGDRNRQTVCRARRSGAPLAERTGRVRIRRCRAEVKASSIGFSWDGKDEMDQVRDDGDAEIQPDGSLHSEIRYRNGDELPSMKN